MMCKILENFKAKKFYISKYVSFAKFFNSTHFVYSAEEGSRKTSSSTYGQAINPIKPWVGDGLWNQSPLRFFARYSKNVHMTHT